MAEKVTPQSPFHGEEARVVVGDFGPFGIECIEFQVLRNKRRWWGGMRPTWVCLYSCTFDGDEGLDKGYTLEQWTEATAIGIREILDDRIKKAEARERYYGATH